MDSKIKELLERYWNCETTLEEEHELRSYFNTETVPDELKDTAALFRYFESQKKIELKKVVVHPTMKTRSADNGKMVKMFFTSAKIAAGVLVLVAATYLVRQEVRKSYPEEVVDT